MSINGTKLGKLAEKLIQPWPDQLYWLQHCITKDNFNFNLRVALFSDYPHIDRYTHYYQGRSILQCSYLL